jgi:N-acyl-D-amino-acid deacylase
MGSPFAKNLAKMALIDRNHVIQTLATNRSPLTAEALGIKDRGALRKGYFADVIVFDERTITDQSTYEQPELLATGMRYVVLNGKVAVENRKYGGALAGRALRKTSP